MLSVDTEVGRVFLTQNRKEKNMSKSASSWHSIFLALRLAWSMGFIIALPAFLFGFGGAYLDRTMETSPLFLLLGLSFSMVFSFLGIKRKIREIDIGD